MSKLNVPIWTGVKIGVNVRVSNPPKSPSFLPIFRNSAAKSRTDQNSGTALPEQHNPLTHTKKATVADDLRGAENGTRTRDLNLGKVALYQLSYFRVGIANIATNFGSAKFYSIIP